MRQMKRMVVRTLCALVCVVMFAAPGFGEEGTVGQNIFPKEWGNFVTFSGAVEAEIGFTDMNDDWAEEDSSDLDLATAELGVDVQVASWILGHALFAWDCEDDNSVGIDEAFIQFGGTDDYPVYAMIGRIYVPFGNFETNMISDPLTVDIGEVREGAVQVGVDMAGFYAAAYGFNSDVDAADDDDEISSFGASAGFAFENDTFSVDLGGGYISNLLSSGMGELVEGDVEDDVAGFYAHFIASIGPFGLIGEYVSAADDIENTEGWSLDQPNAWNAEASLTFEAGSKEVTLAGGYQQTESCAGFLPETRILGSVGVALTDYVGVAVEYALDQDYDEEDGGTDEEKNTVTVQVALEF